MLASLVFGCPGLDWSPIDHLETFAGTQAVTIGEQQASGLITHIFSSVFCVKRSISTLKWCSFMLRGAGMVFAVSLISLTPFMGSVLFQYRGLLKPWVG